MSKNFIVLSLFIAFALMVVPKSICDAQINGVLKKHPMNPRYFTDNSGKVIYLTGSHTWSNFQDNGNGNPPPVFDWTGYLNWMESLHHNFIRLWTWEESRWTSETWDYDYWFYPQTAYKRTGPGQAMDGLPKFNLDSLDDAYFQRMRTRIIEAGERGMYVSIMLFDGWSVSNRLGFRQPFDGCPFQSSNNVNGINGDVDGDGDGEETHSLLILRVNEYQYQFVKKVIDAVNDLDNVLYEISNESPYEGSDEWQKRMVDTVHAYESRKLKQHPVGYTGDWTIPNHRLWESNADWVSPGAGKNGDEYQEDPPLSDGSKVVITDSDHLWGVGGDRVWVWKSFIRGLNPIFMDAYDGKSYGCGGVNFDSSNATWISLRKNLGYSKMFADRMELESVIPRDDLSSTRYCLADTSAERSRYLVYDPASSGSIVLDLSTSSGILNVEWFNPETGKFIFGNNVTGGEVRKFATPFSGDAVLYVYDNRLHATAGMSTGDTVYQTYPDSFLISRTTTVVATVFQIIIIAAVGFFILYLVVLSILALFVKLKTSFPATRKRKFCIITPAHNEELSVARTVQSILEIDYPKELFDSVVIADNCSDKTAQVARYTGAIVMERTNTELRGKGFALRWCFDHFLSSEKGYDAYIVIDADSVPTKNFLSVLNFYLEQGAKVIQVTDIVEPQPGVWSSEMTRIGFLLYNYVRALGRIIINCPTGLHGNGMCFTADVLRNVPWKAYSIAEDLEYGLQLLLKGYPTKFAPEAIVWATMPQQSTHAKSQRARWEGGRFPVIKRYFFPLLQTAIKRFSYQYFDTLIDLVTPALVNLLIISLGMVGVSLGLALIGVGNMQLFLLLWFILSALGFLHMFIGLKASNADRSTYMALLHLPKYVLWKVSIIGKLFSAARSNEWVRTTREQ